MTAVSSTYYFWSMLVFAMVHNTKEILFSDLPKFSDRMDNLTVTVGRDAILECVVESLSTFKVAWLRVDTQTILTIQTLVVTNNNRIEVTHTDSRIWRLRIKEVRPSDRGFYMCQINTDPMKNQIAYLDVVVPPDILDYPTSSDMVVHEGSNVTLQCAATGYPNPTITWRREDTKNIVISNALSVAVVDSPTLTFHRVIRQHMGSYLCIASNGVPPTVSKRITLIVHFAPMVWIQNQLVGAFVGQELSIECHVEAFPKSINYWSSKNGNLLTQGDDYGTSLNESTYKIEMKLTFKRMREEHFGTYHCISKNSLGATDGTIKVYRLPATNWNNNNYQTFVTVSNDGLQHIIGSATSNDEDRNNGMPIRLQESSAIFYRVVFYGILLRLSSKLLLS
ncbi:Immunoglobulin subtype,Immunoglobulin-like domain,Immunoglobulin-like fold,Immunoglobulin subtype [Cinara cedri]|uniref:Immunoglobulin subtype,Immunoglobulin-like domain,Immunoglobulin-like fold,Immunoglobulin subtype n=1 Tax=Cinara cedri TaxID=506608 RepID=A0A5E4NNK8_9HEMI|nr:Immunoglobulin subtype,Immunoglobulin-like domain,Immunoglobulin-like fold,Immunoglobulin subtype [Cinara cedri]